MSEVITFRNSRQAFQYLKPLFHPDQEEFWAIALGSELQVLSSSLIFRGTVDSCPAHPRELFRFLFSSSASSFVIAHNHPRGNALPSRSDLSVTRRFWKIGRLVEIPLNDHLILAKDTYCSLADRGFFLNLRDF